MLSRSARLRERSGAGTLVVIAPTVSRAEGARDVAKAAIRPSISGAE
jgi:hypothetical protein